MSGPTSAVQKFPKMLGCVGIDTFLDIVMFYPQTAASRNSFIMKIIYNYGINLKYIILMHRDK